MKRPARNKRLGATLVEIAFVMPIFMAVLLAIGGILDGNLPQPTEYVLVTRENHLGNEAELVLRACRHLGDSRTAAGR